LYVTYVWKCFEVIIIRVIKVERNYYMRISIESPTRIKMIPEAEHEEESLEELWKIIIRCNEDSKVLCPIGAYVASKDDGASFAIQDQ
jgi:hypothetical protein